MLATVLAACDASVRDELKESQADDIVALLDQQGIQAAKRKNADGTWSVKLIDGREADVARILHQYGVPKEKHAGVVDLFPGESLFPTELEERARYQFALGQELARTLESIDGVLSARVHVSLPEKQPKSPEPGRATASVFVRHRSDQRVDLMKSQIRAMVAQALPGARADDVSVLTVPVYPAQQGYLGAGGSFAARSAGRLAFWLALPWMVAGGLGFALVRRTGGFARWRRRMDGFTSKLLARRRPRRSWS
jgi:type III secretion protein J